MSQQTEAPTSRWWVGIEVGGTFTDVVAVDHMTGEAKDHKVLTTKGELQRGVLKAITELGVPMDDIEEIVHGHTAGINAILSRDGSKTALIATEGHRDLLDIGRKDREFGPRSYDPTWLRPHQERPIIARRDRYGITERIAWDGSVSVALNTADYFRDADVAAKIREHTPSARWETPEEIADPVVFLASDASSFVNGAVLAVGGGWTAGKSF